MSLLFQRDIKVTVGTVQIASRVGDGAKPTLRMAFSVEQQLKGEPDTCELSIWNLKEGTRSRTQEDGVIVVIEAGYVDATSQIFRGDLTHSSTVRQGVDIVTRIECGDGETAYRGARINKSFQPGVTLKALLKEAAGALGVGLGNVVKKADEGDFRGALDQFASGELLSGKVSDVMDRLTKTAGLQWQIHNGQVQLFKSRDTTEDTAIRLTPESGLIGSPELGEKGAIKARSLLQGGLFPARKVEIIASGVDGFYKITKATHSGDTAGNDWYSDIEAVAL